MYVREFMTPKYNIVTCSKVTTLDRVCDIMTEKNIGSVGIVDENGYIVGLITKTDIINAVASGLKLTSTITKSLMSSVLAYVSVNATRQAAADVMFRHKVHHLLVRDEEYDIIGLVSSVDLMKDLVKQFEKCPFLYHLPKINEKERERYEKRSYEVFKKVLMDNEEKYF